MHHDPFADLKAGQRDMWASFAPTAIFTTPVAGHLVKFANVQSGEAVLDIGTGTGVVAITAARAGAQVSALDLTPELLAAARDNAKIARQEQIAWTEGDAEHLPYSKGTFDVVLSQFGHMFAPQPEIVMSEIRRVLKPTGRVAFATWPPEHFTGRLFSFVGRNSPPPPPGALPPQEWGNPAIIAERLRASFAAPMFERGIMSIPALSLEHFRDAVEKTVGPVRKLVERLAAEPKKLEGFRAEFNALAAPYYAHNVVRQDYLLTRASAVAVS